MFELNSTFNASSIRELTAWRTANHAYRKQPIKVDRIWPSQAVDHKLSLPSSTNMPERGRPSQVAAAQMDQAIGSYCCFANKLGSDELSSPLRQAPHHLVAWQTTFDVRRYPG